jgi:serine/threonine protein kinase
MRGRTTEGAGGCASSSRRELLVTTIGKYEVEKLLGAGAMGKVYKARDPLMNRPVALKLIKFSESEDAQAREVQHTRLLRDARNAGALLHPNIVTVYSYEQDGDTPFIVMEYIDGPTLKDVAGDQGRIELQAVLRYMRQAAEALDYAHRRGIVHRDIKPDNIMIGEEDSVKIADFGISKNISGRAAGQTTMTRAGQVVGTPHYMSPEQIQGQPLDGRSDQFSLAVVAYQVLTGQKPFDAREITAILYQIAFENPQPPEVINPALGPSIGKALAKALSKQPGERYNTCLEFVEDLERAAAADLAGLPFAPSTSAAPAAETGSPSVTLGAFADGPRSSRPWRLAAVVAVVLAAIGGLVFLFLPREPAVDPGRSSPAPKLTEVVPALPKPHPPAVKPRPPRPAKVSTPAPPAKPKPRPPQPEKVVEVPPPQEEPVPEVKPTIAKPKPRSRR